MKKDIDKFFDKVSNQTVIKIKKLEENKKYLENLG
jgi:hypothetical protein